MPRFKPILRRVWVALAGTAVLLFLFVLFLPWIINTDPVRNTIQEALSRALGGAAAYQDMEFSILPRPHLAVHQGRFTLADRYAGKVDAIAFYPRLLPLLKGAIEIEKLSITTPEIDIVLPGATQNDQEAGGWGASSRLAKSIRPALVWLTDSGRQIEATNGRVRIFRTNRLDHVFTGITATLEIPEKNLQFRFAYRPAGVDEIVLQGTLGPDTLSFKGESGLTGLQGKNISARLNNVIGSDGVFNLWFEDSSPSFHLEIDVNAEVADLPKILERVIPNRRFREELGAIDQLSGTAAGKLILERTKGAFAARVSVSGFKLHARYPRLPQPVEITGGRFGYADSRISVDQLRVEMQSIEMNALGGFVDWKNTPLVNVEAGASTISVDQIRPWLLVQGWIDPAAKAALPYQGMVNLSRCSLRGAPSGPAGWEVEALGGVKDLQLELPALSETVLVGEGAFELTEKKFTFADTVLRFQDALVRVSGQVNDYPGRPTGTMELEGVLGPEACRRVRSVAHVPRQIRLTPPLAVNRAKLAWNNQDEVSVSGEFSIDAGPVFDIRMKKSPEGLFIENLTVGDAKSRFTVHLDLTPRLRDLSFTGVLKQETLESLLAEDHIPRGSLSGDFRIRLPAGKPLETTIQGHLSVEHLLLFAGSDNPLKISNFSISGENTRLRISSGDVVWRNRKLDLAGTATLSDNGVGVDADISIDGLGWAEIDEVVQTIKNRKSDGAMDLLQPAPLLGVVRLKSAYFAYDAYIWRGIQAELRLNPDSTDIFVNEAELCGVSTQGKIAITPDGLEFNVDAQARNSSLKETILCLGKRERRIDGTFDLSGRFHAAGGKADVFGSLSGDLDLTAYEGNIDRFGILAKVLAYLNLVGVFKDKSSDLSQEGIPFKQITTRWKLKGGKLALENGLLKSPAMEIAGEGHIDMASRKMDMLMLVAPLGIVDKVIKKLPVVRNILNGTLISIPFRVHGPLDNPTTTPLSPKAVGSSLAGFLERVLKMPITIFQPFDPPDPDRPEG